MAVSSAVSCWNPGNDVTPLLVTPVTPTLTPTSSFSLLNPKPSPKKSTNPSTNPRNDVVMAKNENADTNAAAVGEVA